MFLAILYVIHVQIIIQNKTCLSMFHFVLMDKSKSLFFEIQKHVINRVA